MLLSAVWLRPPVLLVFALGLSTDVVSQSQEPAPQQIVIPVGVPLHVRVARTAPLRAGQPVEGVLTQSVFVYDRLVLPEGATVRGRVARLVPSDRKVRTLALLNGDVTPLHDPVVNFSSLTAPGLDLALASEALMRPTQMVNFTPAGKRPSLAGQARKTIKDRLQSLHDAFLAPGRKDRALKLLFSQLPYHPQRIWAGTSFIADLTAPDLNSLPAETPPKLAETSPSALDNLVIQARLSSEVNSETAHQGDKVSALATKPVFNPQHELAVPEGTIMEGTVLQAKASRRFGRNGQLRFAFRSVKLPQEQAQEVRGTLTAAEGNSASNLTVDQEGGVQAHPDKNRFVAPLLLGVLAVAGHDQDRDDSGLGRDTVASNGFGVIARILALTLSNRNVATGFAVYAFGKSIYFRFLARGHAVAFPKDTLVQVQLATRR